MQNYQRSKKAYSTSHTMNYTNNFKANYPYNYPNKVQIGTKPEISAKFDSLHLNNERKVPKSAKDIILYKVVKLIAGQKYELKIVRSHMAYEIRALAVGEELENPIKMVLT